MLYTFTVTKDGTTGDISLISPSDYNKIWSNWNDQSVSIVYKVSHTGEKGKHLHYHGVVESKGKMNYKKMMQEGYSIKFGKEVDEKWFNYCLHEKNQKIDQLERQLQEKKGQELYGRVMDAGQPITQQHIKIRPSKTCEKLVFYIGI